MIVRKVEHNTYMGLSSFAVLPKFGRTPAGGDPAGVLDNCSGFSSVRIEDMIDLCLYTRRVWNIDIGCKDYELELLFLPRNLR